MSLFTLHALWPFLWIWAMAYRPERGWGFKTTSAEEPGRTELAEEVAELRRRVAHLEKQAKPAARPEVKASASHIAEAIADIKKNVGVR